MTTLTYYLVFAMDPQTAANLYQVQAAPALPVSPTTVTFTNGVWTGDVAVLEAAANAYLHVDDGSGHFADSNLFDVLPRSAAPDSPLLLPRRMA